MPRLANRHFLIVTAAALALIAFEGRETQAHKGITSFYDFNKDTYPIFRDRCSICHFEGGPGPMSLTVYKDDTGSGASSWGQSIRDYLVSGHMPPWYIDPFGPAVQGGYGLPVKELDKLITWAAGGTPEKNDTNEEKVKPVAPKIDWVHGAPDLKVQMEAEHTLPPGTLDDTKEFVLSTGLKEARWLKGIDLLPGKPSMVRAATISIDGGPVLTYWVPGNDPIAAPNGTAFRLPADAKLKVEIFYKKSYLDEQNAVSDRSTIGLYFAPQGREIQTVTIEGTPTGEGDGKKLTSAVTRLTRVLAVRPSLDQPYASVRIDAVNGSTRIPLLWMKGARSEWRRRYWLVKEIVVPAGSRIEATFTPFSPNAELPRPVKTYPLNVALDVTQ
jgi:hypothetical protein